MTNKELWQAALGEIELSISKANYITWFKNTNIFSKKDGQVIINVPNAFTKEWLKNKYNKFVLKAIRNISKDIKEIDYIIDQKKEESMPTKKKKVKAPKELKVQILDEQLNFDQFRVDKKTNLNPRYSLNNFIVASFNELAHAAAQSVIKSPGNTYNPLFIYGGVGTGKTHLLQAIGNEITKANLPKKVIYVSSEKFTDDVITAISKNEMGKLKDYYRKIDVLIIDDIQFLAGKEKTQEEFFHTFNALYENNKQIILSSDRPPKAIPTLEERLRSRFEGGMIADIGHPDFETRIVILKTKLKDLDMELPDETLNYIASNIQKNIRELEGALNRIVGFTKLNDSIPTQNQLIKILKNIISDPQKRTTYKNIIDIVAEFYDVDSKDLSNRSRRKEVVKPRQIAMYLLREELKSSYPFIGSKFGGRDHTTAIYACEKIDKEKENNDSLEEELSLIRQRLYNNVL
ncbi:Chromosomal replication initiator protein DnaA [subsurface metagenome]